MKRVVFIFALIFLVGLSSAALEVQKTPKVSTVIAEVGGSAVYDLTVNNKGSADLFEIYSLVGVSMTPKGRFELPFGTSKIEVMAFPTEEMLSETGFFTFSYEIKGRDSGIFKDTMLVEIVPLSEAVEIDVSPLRPDVSKVDVVVKNKENARIDNLRAEFKSAFFDEAKDLSLEPNGEINFSLDIDSDRVRGLSAGPYIVNVEFDVRGKNVEVESVLQYLEKEGTSFEKFTEGTIARKTTLKKTNEGNTRVTATIEVEKDVISRFFTLNNPSADNEDRSGFFVRYSWQRELEPGESVIVESRTNYTFPFILLLVVVAAGFAAKTYSRKAISLQKQVSFVRTKNGVFALKVHLRVRALRHVDSVQVIDSMPHTTKLYEKFGKSPDKIDERFGKLYWNLNSMRAGEERVYSYIIYSKLRVVGRFELPAATAVYDLNGKTEESWSNKAVFATEI